MFVHHRIDVSVCYLSKTLTCLIGSDYCVAGQFIMTGEGFKKGLTSLNDKLYLTSPLFVSVSERHLEEHAVKELRK